MKCLECQEEHHGGWLCDKCDRAKQENSSDTPCCVSFTFEGEFRSDPGRWNEIERRGDLEIAKRDEADYRTWIHESGWRDFRIVKVTTTREILPHNKQDQP